jgi:hypothetical protein
MKRLSLLLAASAALSASTLTDTNFVDAVYLDVLNRLPSTSELSTSLALLTIDTHQQFAAIILGGIEYETNLVDTYIPYSIWLSPNPTLVASYVSLLRASSDQTVQESIFAWGPSDPLLLDRIYRSLLGRSPTLPEFISGEAELGNVGTWEFVAELLAGSEYNQRLLTSYYQQYLSRLPTNSESTMYVPLLAAAGNDEYVQSVILGSSEFDARAQSLPEPTTCFIVGAGLTLMAAIARAGKWATSPSSVSAGRRGL